MRLMESDGAARKYWTTLIKRSAHLNLWEYPKAMLY